ncbi:MAG: hypothetical protein ACXVHB_31975 [Solirubrobacteraceae bacterium]
MVLHAAPKLVPHRDDPFLIIDQNLAVQMVSRHHAERVYRSTGIPTSVSH